MDKKQFLLIIVIVILLSALTIAILGVTKKPGFKLNKVLFNQNKADQEKMIGGSRDSHGCLLGAGYTWCAAKDQCLRVWEKGCTITVLQPKTDSLISSPLTIAGEVEQSWFAGAILPLKLVDRNYNTIALGRAEAKGNEAANGFVPFQSILKFSTKVKEGYLIIANSNSSNEEGLNDSFRIPVKFK